MVQARSYSSAIGLGLCIIFAVASTVDAASKLTVVFGLELTMDQTVFGACVQSLAFWFQTLVPEKQSTGNYLVPLNKVEAYPKVGIPTL